MIEPTAYIDLAALQHNFQHVKKLAANSKIIAMVKSNAYGHGLIEIAKTLKQADAFGVARLREALHLREEGISQDIVLMPGFLQADQLSIISVNNLQPVIHNAEQVSMLEQCELGHTLDVWLKIDTGMGRLGFDVETAVKMNQRLQQCSNVGQVRYLTHFATVDDFTHPHNDHQFSYLETALQQLPGEWSAAKSAAVLAFENTHHHWVRPGVMLYGISAVESKTHEACNLQPVMTLKAPLISIRKLTKGDSVGYGSTYICPEDMLVGVVAIGYGDGYPRHAAQGTPVLIRDKLAPIVGRVCMDMMMIDLREVPDVELGECVTLWGKGLPAEVIAKQAETIAYELLCSVTKRVDFVYEE